LAAVLNKTGGRSKSVWRVPLPLDNDVQAPDALFNLIRSRRSIRRYRPEPIPRQAIERLLEAATWAPSAHNRQPWRFAVITEPKAKERLASAMGDRLRGDRARDGDSPEAIERDVRRSHDRIAGAPLVVVACLSMRDMDRYPDERRASAEQAMAIQSVALAVQNLLLMAHAMSLGACWMCAPLFCQEAVREALSLPDDWEAQALITIGLPVESGKLRARQPAASKAIFLE
jgi:F420 biosynthesis protein FbiB-like protein